MKLRGEVLRIKLEFVVFGVKTLGGSVYADPTPYIVDQETKQ